MDQIINVEVYVQMDIFMKEKNSVTMEIDLMVMAVTRIVRNSQGTIVLDNLHFACQYVEMVC